MWVFCRLVKEIGQSIESDLHWQSSEILALQNGAEDYLVRLLDNTNLCAVLLISMWVFCRLVKEIGQGIESDLHWQSSAILALQNGAEDYLMRLLDNTNLCAIHAHWQTIMSKDIQLAHRICGEWNLIRYNVVIIFSLNRIISLAGRHTFTHCCELPKV